MNLREFNALKVGDEVENAMTNGAGTVSAVYEPRSGRVVSVKWGGRPQRLNSGVEFSYSVQSTAWMHWNKVVEPSGVPDGWRTLQGPTE